MLTGKDLGAAIREAMTKKGVVQSDVAEAFGIKQPSVSEWLKFGRVSKKHINHLVHYFSDVVGPEHWGLPASWGTGGEAPEPPMPDIRDPANAVLRIMAQLTPEARLKVLQFAATQLPIPQESD
jgi:transcriptional regulator with XRE-family HTH domain